MKKKSVTYRDQNKKLEQRLADLNNEIIALKQENSDLDKALKDNNLSVLHEIKAFIKNITVERQLIEMIIANTIVKYSPDEHDEHLMALKGLRDLMNQMDVINKFLPEKKDE